MPEFVTNDRLRRELGRWLQRAEDGFDVVVVDRKAKGKDGKRGRTRVRLVPVSLVVDVERLEKEEEIYL